VPPSTTPTTISRAPARNLTSRPVFEAINRVKPMRSPFLAAQYTLGGILCTGPKDLRAGGQMTRSAPYGDHLARALLALSVRATLTVTSSSHEREER
jgi:hypothetical protein